ncbi:hypothetical protein VCRA2126O85_60175 [Vibrio crassostreae]|nr:hypothetical protein VCRA2125O83_60055 [Vibrio crassostreae]CAK3061528.1 hypothetical protein VCRA2126O84_60055 [Vibrio crassostreae]CAK3069553.1 hypothetical protein VCRA2126O86_60175 [Vibrio crassostreae]CAK3071687.1 hypothetical protein VCRA2128O106_60176 [Vibrio crassostreae]CAK3071808.1 hypothetical protein VCRA2126O85_60175 [Vibrio crassostreae]
MAKVFGVSRSGFYYWIDNHHKVTQRKEHREKLDCKVREVFDDKKERDGARRIQKELEENGKKHDLKTIVASMKRQSLVAKVPESSDVRQTASIGFLLPRTCLSKTLMRQHRTKNGLEILPI